MNKIEVKVLNEQDVIDYSKWLAFAARITQHSVELSNMNDVFELFNKPVKDETVKKLITLPHPTLQKFAVINVIVVGASRRFLAQITRHQNEVKFMSGSLQYNDYSNKHAFVIPYSLLNTEYEQAYVDSLSKSMQEYSKIAAVVDHDDAGYAAPQGLRNILLISATPYQWKYMIGLRTCRRNSTETRYVMLKIWEELFKLNPELFSVKTTGPACLQKVCSEGNMSCGMRPTGQTPSEMLDNDFEKLR